MDGEELFTVFLPAQLGRLEITRHMRGVRRRYYSHTEGKAFTTRQEAALPEDAWIDFDTYMHRIGTKPAANL